MRTITMAVYIQFDADQVTQGSVRNQAEKAVDMLNESMLRDSTGLAAQIIDLDDRDLTEGFVDEDESNDDDHIVPKTKRNFEED